MNPVHEPDVIIIGAGLAGLVAGLNLQRAGVRSLIVEKLPRAGGLCGSFAHEGATFTIGCNDFGVGLERELDRLGVPVRFERPRGWFFFAGGRVDLPLDLRSALRLARRAPGLLRAYLAGRRSDVRTLGDLFDRHVRDTHVADLICMLAYGTGRAPRDIEIASLGDDFDKEHAYGYETPVTPVGGPEALARAMVRRFEDLGGKILLETPALGVEGAPGHYRVHTKAGILSARAVITGQGRWDAWPRDSKPGLRAAALLFTVDARFAWPAGVHTMAWFPRGVAAALQAIDEGDLPERPPFNWFKNGGSEREGVYTVNAYVLWPRGDDAASAARAERIERHVVREIDGKLPGFAAAVRKAAFLSPAAYTRTLGLSSAVVPRLAPLGFRKPAQRDPATGLWHVGHSVLPAANHAGAAVRGGHLAAAGVIEELRRPAPSATAASPSPLVSSPAASGL